jgi:hypothetical protein
LPDAVAVRAPPLGPVCGEAINAKQRRYNRY